MPRRQVKNPPALTNNMEADELEPAAQAKRKPGRSRKAKEPAPINTDLNQSGVNDADGQILPQPMGQKRPRLDKSKDCDVPDVGDNVAFNAFLWKIALTDLISQAKGPANQPAAPPAPKKPRTTNSRKTGNQRTLPAREGRNIDPAAAPGVKAATRRSQAEVTAERQAKTKEAEEAYRKYKNAQLALAQLHADEENSPESANLRLSAAVGRKRSRSVLSIPHESDGEVFDLDAVVGSSDEESDDDRPMPKAPVKLKIKNGRPKEKGLRDKVDALVGGLRKDGDGESKKKRAKGSTINENTLFPALDLAPKKYKDAGLLPAVSGSSIQIANIAASGNLNKEDNVVVLGGLADEDAAAARPTNPDSETNNNLNHKCNFERPLYPAGLKRDASRLNETVELEVLDSSDSDSSRLKKARTKSAPKKASQSGGGAAVIARNRNAQGKAGQKEHSVTLSLSAESFLHDTQWKAAFLPSLIHSFFVSKEPLKHFKQSSEELHSLVQGVFNLSFPHVRYEITAKDKVLRTAYCRIKTKRSLIATETLDMVHKHFATKEYAGKPTLIKQYARWALRGDGPAYNLQPTPSDCTVPPSDDGYIPPDGVFQSHFMHTIANKYLQHANGSKVEPPIGEQSPPVGLYALIAASLERAFKAYASGVFNEPKSFTIEEMWPSVNTFTARAQQLSNRRWKEVLAGPIDNNVDDELNISNISAFRDNFYIPESPVKPPKAH